MLEVALCAAVAALGAWLLTGFMRSCAQSEAPILQQWFHLGIAAGYGALAGLGQSWAEQLTFVVLAIAAGLLTVIDIAEERLPDRIVLPLMPMTFALLAVAAWTTGLWGSLITAGICAAALFILYFVQFMFARDLGFGDVKLAVILGAVGGWFGFGSVVLGYLVGWVAFALVGIVALLTKKRATGGGSLPMGPFLIAGAAAGILLAPVVGW